MKKALVVGVDDYPSDPLTGCVNDARSIGGVLASGNYSYQVESLLNGAVTRKALKKGIEGVLERAECSVIYFAGHGWKSAVTTYLATHDAEEGDEGIDLSYVTAAISRLTTENQSVVVILDCCHSGDASPRAGFRNIRNLEPSDIPNFAGSGRVLMAACQGSEKAWERTVNGEVHGAFTSFLIDGLTSRAADTNGFVTVNRCFEYVARELEQLRRQTPVLKGDQTGRIIIGRIPVAPLGSGASSDLATSAHSLASVRAEAKAHVEALYAATPRYGYEDYNARGHREACQRLSPILNWFQRRMADLPDLMKDSEFQRSWSSIFQQYTQLSLLSAGTALDDSRRIEKILGSGTFGTVWLVQETGTGKLSCFKSYHANDLRDLEKSARFTRGYQAMRQLDHPNIIKVQDFCDVPLGFYMRFIDGPNLRLYNPSTSLDTDSIIDLLLVIGETLQHAHGRAVLHRDVKPENILIDFDTNGQPRPYLTDFDLAWFSTATKLTRVAEGFGSHFYAAPEQMNNPSSPVAHQSTVDSYSFAQVMFYSVCGRDPAAFDTDGNQKALSRHLGSSWTDEQAAKMMYALYADCSAKDPRQREGDFRKICDRLSMIRIRLRDKGDTFTAQKLLSELRFSLAGLRSDDDRVANSNPGFIEFRSQSGRTQILVTVKLDTGNNLSLEATYNPDQIVVQAGSASAARAAVNSRIDTALEIFRASNSCVRTNPKHGPYQAIVTFSNITKDVAGLNRAREIIVRAIDSVERM